jgi:CHAT domain-containing protein/tetratricopeptide (TPR) repeat protein
MFPSPSQCPTAETLGVFLEGRLSPEEQTAVEAHLSGCDQCMLVAGEVAAWNRELGRRDQGSRAWHSSKRWLVAAAAVITATAAFLLVREPFHRDPMRHLAAVAERMPTRPVEARLSAFGYRPAPATRRSERQEWSAAGLALQAEAAKLLEATGGTSRSADGHARGVAALIVGDPRLALEQLRAAARERPHEARIWSDLSAAEYVQATTTEDVDAEMLVRAIADAGHALEIDPRNAVALFNRALAVDALHLIPPASHAWGDYLRVDAGSEWAAEARERLSHLDRRTRIEQWRSEVLPELERAVARRDERTIHRIVESNRQQARTWSEVQFFAEWAEAWASHSTTRANERLDVARMVGNSLAQINGETLLRDAVQAIDRATPAERMRLAKAQRTYVEARRLHHAGSTDEATPLFEEAMRGFAQAHSPMAYVAEYYVSICRHVTGANDASLAIINRILATAPQYRALCAQLQWQRGTDFGRAGALIESLEALRTSLRLFEELGEQENANLMRHNIAATEAALGHHGAAWAMRLEIFRGLSAAGDRAALQSAVEAAARTEALAQRWETATALLTLALDPDLRANHSLYVSTLLWRALAAHRLGRDAAAARDLGAARIAAEEMKTGALREEAINNLRFVDAVLVRRRDPQRASALLSDYLAHSIGSQDFFLVPEALLERARARRILEDREGAIADLTELLLHLEKRRHGQHGFEEAFFATADSATRELIDLMDGRGDIGGAFAAAERARARSIADRLQGVIRSSAITSDSIRPLLGPGAMIVEYVVLDDRVLIFTLDGSGLRIDRASIAAEVVAAEAESFVRLVRASHDPPALLSAGRLYEWLVAPFSDRIEPGSTLVIIADPLLAGVPFAALRNPITGQFLIERAPIVSAPSAATYAAIPVTPRRHAPGGRSLIVGNPAIDRNRFPFLPALPDAESEAMAIAQETDDATVLLGRAATKQRVLAALPSSTVIHIASHVVAVETDPPKSFLVLAPSATDSGALYLHELANTPLVLEPLVVLAGCRTSAPAEGYDVGNFSLAFLAAGSRNVVGTLWDVDDAVAGFFSTAFHRRIRSGGRPADAVRNIQIQMLRSTSPTLSPLRAWSAFQITGNGL